MLRRVAVPLVVMSPALVECMTPVVLWHGMGDSCCLPFSMGALKGEIEAAGKAIGESVFVHSIMIGNNEVEDELEGFFGNMNSQVKQVCDDLQKMPELKDGFNAIGFSQGGQLMRAYVQRCNNPPVKQLITMGGQHFGIADIPDCDQQGGVFAGLCKEMSELLGRGAYLPGVRDVSIQAQYFRAPMEKASYLADNIFLPDINNENTRNQKYKDNLISLEKFVLIMFAEDTVVVPRESSWFGYFPWGTLDYSKMLNMTETQLYKEDWVGLRTLDEAGKVVRKSCPSNHMKFSMDYFKDEVINDYLLPVPTPGPSPPKLNQAINV